MRHTLLFGCLGSFAVLASLQACGSTTAESEKPPVPLVPREEFGQRLLETLCKNLSACCPGRTVAECDPIALKPFTLQAQSPTISYDSTKANACLTQAADFSKSCKQRPHSGPCDEVFVGM